MPTLAEELAADPLSLGYAPLLTVADDSAVAALLNARTGAGTDTLTLARLPRNEWLAGTVSVAVRVEIGVGTDAQPLDAVARAKWRAVIEQARASDPGSLINLGLLSILGDPVSDRVMAQGELDALTTRIGSRAEVLWGAGTIITPDQVGAAR